MLETSETPIYGRYDREWGNTSNQYALSFPAGFTWKYTGSLDMTDSNSILIEFDVYPLKCDRQNSFSHTEDYP